MYKLIMLGSGDGEEFYGWRPAVASFHTRAGAVEALKWLRGKGAICTVVIDDPEDEDAGKEITLD